VVSDHVHSRRGPNDGHSAVVGRRIGGFSSSSLERRPNPAARAKNPGAVSSSCSGRLEFHRPTLLGSTLVFRLEGESTRMTTNSTIDSGNYLAPLRAPIIARHCER